jgi:N-methylhydantoinase B
MNRQFDPILVEVMKNELSAVAEEMGITMKRTARSIGAREAGDFSTALVDAEGRLIAQGLTIGIHLGYIMGVMPWVLKKFGGRPFDPSTALRTGLAQDRLQKGDVIVSNDPYGGVSHLPDIVVIMPIFWRDELVGFSAIVEHHTDIGGRFPGGMGIACAEIYEEGVRLPGVKLYNAGKPNRDLLDFIAANVRVPQDVLGDLEAQVAACRRGEQGLTALMDKYGRDTFAACNAQLRQYSEQAVRGCLESIPDGSYVCEDVFEDDGLGGSPSASLRAGFDGVYPEHSRRAQDRPGVKLVVRVEVEGDGVTVDFTGTDPQVKSAINVPLNLTRACVYVAFRSILGTDAPANSGLIAPIRVIAPEGCVINAQFPAAVGARGMMMWRIIDMVFAALAQAIPERVYAAGEGGFNMLLYTPKVESGVPAMLFDLCGSGWGGRPTQDGIEGVTPIAAGGASRSIPAEIIEREVPVMIEGFGFVPDSGGAGKFRGALSVYRKWRFLADGRAMVRTCRVKSVSYGLAGGRPGTPFQVLLESDTRQAELPAQMFIDTPVQAGDRLIHIQPGAGGYGDPWERDPWRVREDVLDEKITVAYAEREYGVVIDPRTLEINQERTAALKQSGNGRTGRESVGAPMGTSATAGSPQRAPMDFAEGVAK